MPVWRDSVQSLVDDGQLAVVGVIQEQHPERCRLFCQWQNISWPILHDPINQLGLQAVPVPVAIDEHGVVRELRPRPDRLAESFVRRTFDEPDADPPAPAERPDIAALSAAAARSPAFESWLQLGDAQLLWGGPSQIDSAIKAYQAALKHDSGQAAAHFRLGVAYRLRHDGSRRQVDDFQQAVEQWGRALELSPNQYIYRRRIQQYGPRLIKPYSFYDWVQQARREIRQRGETPIALPVEPSGAELAHPSRQFAAEGGDSQPPDPQGRINRDRQPLIRIQAVTVPARIAAGEAVRLHLEFAPAGGAHWNNGAEPLLVWLEPPDGWGPQRRQLEAPQPRQAESTERRRLEVEIRSPEEFQGEADIKGYALYYVCEESGGTCLYLRQDFKATVRVR